MDKLDSLVKDNLCYIKCIDSKISCLEKDTCCVNHYGDACSYLSSTGCTTKCLSCKLHICNTFRNNYPEVTKQIDELYMKILTSNVFAIYRNKFYIDSLNDKLNNHNLIIDITL